MSSSSSSNLALAFYCNWLNFLLLRRRRRDSFTPPPSLRRIPCVAAVFATDERSGKERGTNEIMIEGARRQRTLSSFVAKFHLDDGQRVQLSCVVALPAEKDNLPNGSCQVIEPFLGVVQDAKQTVRLTADTSSTSLTCVRFPIPRPRIGWAVFRQANDNHLRSSSLPRQVCCSLKCALNKKAPLHRESGN